MSCYYLRGALKDKCYADKPEIIDALKDNIREAIGEIQLHTIDTVLKNWTARLGYCMASRGSHLSEIMMSLDYYLWGAVKAKCYADKLERIDALKDNIREAIGEIQLHTIDKVHKNWTNYVGYCMTSRGSHLNEIIFHY